jgi:hypothetical protein
VPSPAVAVTFHELVHDAPCLINAANGSGLEIPGAGIVFLRRDVPVRGVKKLLRLAKTVGSLQSDVGGRVISDFLSVGDGGTSGGINGVIDEANGAVFFGVT